MSSYAVSNNFKTISNFRQPINSVFKVNNIKPFYIKSENLVLKPISQYEEENTYTPDGVKITNKDYQYKEHRQGLIKRLPKNPHLDNVFDIIKSRTNINDKTTQDNLIHQNSPKQASPTFSESSLSSGYSHNEDEAPSGWFSNFMRPSARRNSREERKGTGRSFQFTEEQQHTNTVLQNARKEQYNLTPNSSNQRAELRGQGAKVNYDNLNLTPNSGEKRVIRREAREQRRRNKAAKKAI